MPKPCRHRHARSRTMVDIGRIEKLASSGNRLFPISWRIVSVVNFFRLFELYGLHDHSTSTS